MSHADVPPVSSGGSLSPGSFDRAWAQVQDVSGWLKEGQARILWDEATALREGGTVLEIGSHQGRSTIILGEALRDRGGRVLAVDPFVEGKLFGGLSTKDKFEHNIAANDLEGVVELVQNYSTSLRPTWERPFDLLYIDGKHDYWTLSDDLRWSVHLPEGGGIVIHDCYSSIGVTLGILRHVLFSDRITYERRSNSQALFRVKKPTAAERLRIVKELPWWLRNVFIKVLLRLKLRPVATLFGHDSPYDPY